MTRLPFLLVAVCLAGVLAAGGPTGAASPPNIVVFLTDDQDQLDSSVYSDRRIRTPQMERLARAGIRPVSSAARLGAHVGEATKAWVKVMPARASRSICGVRIRRSL